MRTPNTDFLSSCFSFAHCLFQVATEMARLRGRCVDPLLLLGASKGYRILPSVQLRIVLATINLGYAVAATSWLLYGIFTALCYPIVFVTCLFQFNFVAHIIRARLRGLPKQLHFVDDKIVLFDIPALEIDVDVDGLMVV